MKINTSQKPHSKKNFLVITAAVLLLLVGGYTVAAATMQLWPFVPANQAEDTFSEGYTDNPPSNEELEASQDAKKRNDEQTKSDTATNPDNNTTTTDVSVAISYADVIDGQLEIRAFTNGVIEGSGTCTATITKDLKTITKESEAFIDVSSSICRPIYVSLDELSSGVWDVQVRYTSGDASGTSETVKVSI